MARAAIIIPIFFLLTACATELDVLTLKEGDTPDIVIQAHRVTIKKLQKWGLEQEVLLDGYRKEK